MAETIPGDPSKDPGVDHGAKRSETVMGRAGKYQGESGRKPRSENQVEKGREKDRLPLEWLIQRRISVPDLL